MKPELKFRIVVEEPLKGVTYAVQRGRSEWLPPARSTPEELVFEFPLTVADLASEPPRLTGAYAQGPAKGRFVYVNSGTMAGQESTCWTRRAKVHLSTLHRSVLEDALGRTGEDPVIEARIHGLAKDGGPACASVPLRSPWTVRGPA